MLAAFRWILPGRLAGSGQPGLLDSLDADVELIRRLGIRTVVTLTEQQHVDTGLFPELRWLHFPIDDMRTPTPRQCEQICRAVIDSLNGAGPVLIHCRAGLGRTGLVAACCLVRMGQTPADALREARRIHERYVQTPAQEKFIEHYATFLAEQERDEEEGHRRELLQPSRGYFEEIGGEAGVLRVLTAFYDKAFDDPRLGPFFKQTHKETIRAKQVAFMKRCFTGESDGYMGQRPRNAHHWMVISDDDFDYRERLMEETLVEQGFTAPQIARWIAVENGFRRQIVKDRPWPLFYRGVQTCWASEAKEETAQLATVCDECTGEIESGASLWMLGDRTLCPQCVRSTAAAPAAES